MTQELAHAIGLVDYHDINTYQDLNGDGHSVMYPCQEPGHAHRQLSDRDSAFLDHLYPQIPQGIIDTKIDSLAQVGVVHLVDKSIRKGVEDLNE